MSAKDQVMAQKSDGSKRFFGKVEVVFHITYFLVALGLGLYIISKGNGLLHWLAGSMAFILVAGDAFHLVPRIASVITGDPVRFRRGLGLGKLITSITMTLFYVLLWQIGVLVFPPIHQGFTILIYLLAALRILFCLSPKNQWYSQAPPITWAVLRNVPFVFLGFGTILLFLINSNVVPALSWLWLAATLSFAFYIPVILGAGRRPILGMLMLPKTCMYVWLLWMFAAL